MNSVKRWWIAAFLVVAMVATAGCEAVGGVDVNKAIVSSIVDQKSVEGEFTLDWTLTPDPKTMPDEETARMLRQFGSGKLSFTEMKTQDQKTASMKGVLELKKGSLPFALYIANNKIVFDVEGAKAPFLLDMYGNQDPDIREQLGVFGDPEALQELLDPNGELGRKVMGALGTYLLRNTPNPEKATVGSVTETINGQTKSLTEIRFEIEGDEFDDLLIGLLVNLAEDKEGLKELLSSLYDALKPAMAALRNELAANGEDASSLQMLDMAISNKTLAVELAYEFIAPFLDQAAKDIKQTVEMPGSELDELFGQDSGVTISFFLEGGTVIGSDFSLLLTPNTEDTDGLASIGVNASSRAWNINGDVKAETYNGEVFTLNPEASPRERLANITEGSLLYDILKNDLGVTRHSFDLYMGYEADVPDGFSPYIKGVGTTMVPVRYVSERLYADVTWDEGTQTITIRDNADETTIVMTIGSNIATVNGVTQTLPEAPELLPSGSTFVPIAFITKALGGTAHWNAEQGIVTIKKEF